MFTEITKSNYQSKKFLLNLSKFQIMYWVNSSVAFHFVFMLIILFVSSFTAYSNNLENQLEDSRGRVRLGSQFIGLHEIYYPYIKNNVAPGYSVSGEWLYKIFSNTKVGVGAEFQLPRSTVFDHHFNFAQIYGALQILVSDYNVNPYVYGRTGLSFFFSNSSYKGDGYLIGGAYYSLGIGVELIIIESWNNKYKLLIETGYASNQGRLSGRQVNYNRIEIFFGVDVPT